MLTRRHWNQAALATAAGLAAPWPLARAAAAAGPDEAFADIAARYFADRMELDPLQASMLLADPAYEGRLAITIAPAEIARARALNQRVERELAALPPATLGPAARLSHELLAREVREALEGDAFPDHLMPIDQYGGLPLALANLAAGDQFQPLKTAQDHENYLRRLDRLPAYVTQAIANMREGMARGITRPRALIVSALPPLRKLAAPTLEGSPFGAALKALPAALPAAERGRLARAYQAAYARRIRPALQQLLAFLQGPYLAACRTSAGLGALPEGDAWYAFEVRSHTTTDQGADEIHAIGLAEVARIRAEMAKLQPALGFDGGVTDFLRWHAQQARFRPFRSWDEIVAAFERLNERVVPQLPQLFGRLPRQPLAIRAIPAFQRATTSPYYNPPAPDGSRPGIFFVGAPIAAEQYNNAEMTSLLLHEGQPGHHFHASLQQDLALPAFRRHGWIDAFGEGWALYAETLGREMGLYEDPNQLLGHLKMELHRAVRLVTDTGLHAKGWTREATMRYMMDAEGIGEAEARLSTERYMAWPGQALAYKTGALKIQALRRRAQERLGSRFRLADFHDRVLAEGTLPLAVLEREIERWLTDAAAGGAA